MRRSTELSEAKKRKRRGSEVSFSVEEQKEVRARQKERTVDR